MNDSVYMYGKVKMVLKDENGEVVQAQAVKNMIVTTGRNLVAQLLTGAADAKPVKDMALGSGNSPTKENLTGLESEIKSKSDGEKLRSLLNIANIADSDNGTLAKVEATFSGNNCVEDDSDELAITEAGLFTEGTTKNANGVMYNRVTFSPIPLRKGYELTLLWEITFPKKA